jgi:hypothetical protein
VSRGVRAGEAGTGAGNVVVGGSYSGGGSSGRSSLVCVYTFTSVEIKTNTETVALGMHENVQAILVAQAGRRSPDFFELTILDFLSCLLPTL